MAVVILDRQDNALLARQIGQVAIRSPATMLGYWSRPDATAATIDRSGWLRTGDAGQLDPDGYLFVHDRR